MRWSDQVNNGWKHIVDALEYASANYEDIQVFQIKEKFGTLRFYCSGGGEEFQTLVDLAEAQSSITCEICGNSGKLKNDKGWLRTMCDNHD